MVLATAGIVLVDTMIVIEAVDTGCWNALTGQVAVVTARGAGGVGRRTAGTTLQSAIPRKAAWRVAHLFVARQPRVREAE